MTRHCMFGPDVTFLGIDRCDLADLSTYAEADVVVLGAPFDSGTSYRPGARFGPMAIRSTDYLPHDGSRPHLALGVDPLQDMRVVDAGDIEMPPTETELSPGTGTPEPGGLTSRQLLDAVRRLALRLPIVGMDVVEVAPAYDSADVTAMLANRVVLEALSGIAARRKA